MQTHTLSLSLSRSVSIYIYICIYAVAVETSCVLQFRGFAPSNPSAFHQSLRLEIRQKHKATYHNTGDLGFRISTRTVRVPLKASFQGSFKGVLLLEVQGFLNPGYWSSILCNQVPSGALTFEEGF